MSLRVFRVQNAAGGGPYGWPKYANHTERGYDAENEPGEAPKYDFPLDADEDLRNLLAQDVVRFGFTSMATLERWFHVCDLAELGFNVVEVEAERVWVSKSGRQCCFVPKGQER